MARSSRAASGSRPPQVNTHRYTDGMHSLVISALVGAALAFCARKQDDPKNSVTIHDNDLTPTVTRTVRTPEPTTLTTPVATPSGGVIEVQGIIGVIDRAAGVITINPLQG